MYCIYNLRAYIQHVYDSLCINLLKPTGYVMHQQV